MKIVPFIIVMIVLALSANASEFKVSSIQTRGAADLLECTSFVLAASCKPYEGVRIPSSLRLGDQIKIDVPGKQALFVVKRLLAREDGTCWAFDTSAEELGTDTLTVKPCVVERR